MSMEPIYLGGGRYELAGLLGRGGMAEVRLAHDVRLGRTVAIKRLRPDLASDPTFQARFRREAQSAASLNHPAIVAVYDTGEEESADGSGVMLPYIVMEHIEGKTLRDVLREDRRILPERALEIAGAVLDALDYSHRAGIIHRDIKPANVMLMPSGDIKVMDFGIARAIADSSATMTQTAAVLGTAQYLSPEQARGEQVDARSDLYSTGCLLFELLTGRPPFVGDSPVAVAYQHVREEPPAPSSFDPDISPAIDAITLKALTKRVDDRYQSAAEMRADIDRALEGRSVLAPVVIPASDETQPFLTAAGGPPSGASASTDEEEPQGRSRRGLWALALLLLVAGAIAALLIIPGLGDEDSPPQVTVPDLNNLTVRQAEDRLDDRGLTLGATETDNSSTYAKNRIMRQTPATGVEVNEGSAVDIVVSLGARTTTVPDVTEGTLAEAKETLEGLGLVVSPVAVFDSTERRNEVTETLPAAGAQVEQGGEVKVSYSTGLPRVPNVVGDTLTEAQDKLDDFVPSTSYVESDAPRDQVVGQTPPGGTRLQRGGIVELEVSQGPDQTPSTVTITTETTPTETTPTETTETTPTETTETTPTETETTETGGAATDDSSAPSETSDGLADGQRLASTPVPEGSPLSRLRRDLWVP